MGATTHGIFGDAPGSQPATPGSYGEAPRGFRLPDATRLGAVTLQVSSLGRSIDWYERVLGLEVRARDDGRASLAARDGGSTLVELRERPGAHAMTQRGRLGLYHFAILLPDRAALGRFVRHLGDTGVRAGAGDHLVSEALYLQDPDGLGIEVYADRPRDAWRRVGRELMMATDPVDVRALVAAAAAFYSDALGFDRMVWSYPQALFFGAGGYHHHLGTNTWAGPGARRAADDDARLIEWIIALPAAGDVDAAVASLERAGHAVERASDGSATARDPWGTTARLRVGA